MDKLDVLQKLKREKLISAMGLADLYAIRRSTTTMIDCHLMIENLLLKLISF